MSDEIERAKRVHREARRPLASCHDRGLSDALMRNTYEPLLEVARAMPTMIDRLDRAMGDTDLPDDMPCPDRDAMQAANLALDAALSALREALPEEVEGE